MPSSWAIDNALIAKLVNDAPLTALMPDGVYRTSAPEGKTRFIVISLIEAPDVPMFQGRAFEEPLYHIEAVELSQSGLNANAAADRIDTLLDNQPLVIPGYTHCLTQRENRFAEKETDEQDASIVFQRRGGDYLVVVS